MNRRSFLKLASLGPTLVALQNLPLAGLAGAARAAPRGDAILDAHERELFLTIIERMVDMGEPGAPAPRELGVLETLEGLLAQLDLALVDSVRTALKLVDWWPATGELRFKRFGALTPEEQDASLEGWRRSGLETRRRVFYALRNLSFHAYWSRKETWGLIGYPGPWIRWPS
jgi:hypothetical protein